MIQGTALGNRSAEDQAGGLCISLGGAAHRTEHDGADNLDYASRLANQTRVWPRGESGNSPIG